MVTIRRNAFFLLLGIAFLIAIAALAPFILQIGGIATRSAFRPGVRVLAGVALFTLLAISLVETAAPFFNKGASWMTTCVAWFGLLSFLFSHDSAVLFPWESAITNNPIWGNAVFTISFLCFCFATYFITTFLQKNYGIFSDKKEFRVVTFYLIGEVLLYAVLIFFQMAYLAIFAHGILLYFLTVRAFYAASYKEKTNLTFFFAIFIEVSLFCCTIANTLGHDFPGFFTSLAVPSLFAILAGLCFVSIYIVFVLFTTREADEKRELEEKTRLLQANVLKAQIQPHFIFNVLNAIKTTYYKDVNKGAIAMDRFAEYLRSYTKAANIYLIGLPGELEMIENYLELENMKTDRPFEVIFNIDEMDFEVPFFGIQPVVENAIRYSKINEFEGGYIEIRSYADEDHYYINVIDNGVGFDANSISPTSYGLSNVRDRFRLLLNAELTIQSAPGEGTTISIAIPKGGNDHESDRR